MLASDSTPISDYERGLDLLAGGDHFGAHEALEDAWRRAEPDERDFFQGLVHVAVAWYQAGRGRTIGCERQLGKAARRLGPFAPFHGSLDLADLLEQVEAAQGSCPSLPPVRICRGDPHRLEQALAFVRATQDACAEEMVPAPWGHTFLAPRLPQIYDLNYLRVEPGAAPRTADELAGAADEILGSRGIAFRRVVVHDESLGAGLASGFRELGWLVGRFLVMTAGKPASGPDPAIEVGELEHDAYLEARRSFLAAEGVSDELAAQILELGRRTLAAIAPRLFAAFVDGRPVSVCELRSDGNAADIEDVVTLPDHRRRGLAGAVVARALQESLAAGHELTFIVVDSDSGPHPLYRRLGFRPVGLEYVFFRPPGSA